MSTNRQHTDIRKVRDLGKPGCGTGAVELEVTVSRREVFKVIVPFLVASFLIGAQNGTAKQHEMAADNE